MKTQQNQIGDLFDSVWDSAYAHFKNPTIETSISLDKETQLLRNKINLFKY
ncbi:hypothetical protein [Flagellimonas marina]|uniref:Uncharacterized protein n=1 Tax=Flagellimonas marina TaxID=1775168 RepID=A0ABV8PLA8_9FLAO